MSEVVLNSRRPEETRRKLLDASRDLILTQGFTGTRVDQICRMAGVTKGAFFHHFQSKDELGQAALADWAHFGMDLYAAAKSQPARHPLDHLHRFFDIMIGFVRETPGPVTCVVGIISQEMSLANPVLQQACATYLGDWTAFTRQLLDEAKAAQPPKTDFDSEELAWFLNGLWQGSMLVAKARQDPRIIVLNLERARAYVDDLFGIPAAPG
ncbi:MAG TPA: TetR/AcrR family transcriptional regulator [Chthoniobacterales bacterium]